MRIGTFWLDFFLRDGGGGEEIKRRRVRKRRVVVPVHCDGVCRTRQNLPTGIAASCKGKEYGSTVQGDSRRIGYTNDSD